MSKIKIVKAREILDSRGNPTVETKITLDDGVSVEASVPSGASLGKYEALELRDEDIERYNGMGVLKAVANVNEVIAPKIVGLDPVFQEEIDHVLNKLDGTENKSKLGANAILSVSQAACEAGAAVKKIPIYLHVSQLFGVKENHLKVPSPVFNLINGGKHGAGNLNFQEFHIVPSERLEYPRSLEAGEEIYHSVEKILIRNKAVHCVGDEGGFAPNLFTNADALEVLKEAVHDSGYSLGTEIFLGLDVAAGQFYKGGKYQIIDRTMPMDTKEFVEFYSDLNNQYPLTFLEDPFHEDDWEGWKSISRALPQTIIVGDDLLATNKTRVERAIKEKGCSALLAKPNQAGTISETIKVIKIARNAGWKVIVAHRSGETTDDFIADFAVGVMADNVKFGAPARGERVVKYNRLLTIYEEQKA